MTPRCWPCSNSSNSASAARPGERSRSLVDQAGDFLERIAELLPGKQRDVLAD